MADVRAVPPSVWARIADYLLGRNALIGVATLMLLAISGYATWSGMHDFIVGVSTQAHQMVEGPGGIALDRQDFVIAIVATLTFLMWLALRETFGAQRRITERMITFPLYCFLALWSVGFGYGFWWSLIAGNEATRTSIARLQEDARDAAGAVTARLQAVRAQLDGVTAWSDSQMAREETSGGSCGVASNAGRGPLYAARRTVRDQITAFRDGIDRSWLAPIQADVDKLRDSVALPDGGTLTERQQRFEAKASEIRGAARGIAARSNELGATTAAGMRALATTVSIAPNQPGFSCHDPVLAQRLLQAADQAAQKAEPRLRDAAFSEGPAGVANAVRTLWSNIGDYGKSVGRFIASGGREDLPRTASGEPITGRDVIALLATLGVDFGIFALAALNPPAAGPVRRDALAANEARLHLPTAAVVEHLKRAIETAIARAPGDDANFEWVRRHFIHHNGSSYFVIPNLYHTGHDKTEELRALAMNQLTGVFADLRLVRALTRSELKRLGREEERDSYSSLTPFRQRWHAERADGGEPTAPPPDKAKPIRNHGLFSKAQRALDIAGWSGEAQADAEIFRLVDTDGLTPLLIVLNDAHPIAARPQEAERHTGATLPVETVPVETVPLQAPAMPAVDAPAG